MTASSLEEARLPLDHAAALLAISDGLCKIGASRTGIRAGQFSIFNFLLRCAEEPQRRSAERPAYVAMMRAGIMRRRTWYCRYWLPAPEQPLQLELPAPIARGWEWWLDIAEIERRLRPAPAWREAVGDPLEARIAHFRAALAGAAVLREAP